MIQYLWRRPLVVFSCGRRLIWEHREKTMKYFDMRLTNVECQLHFPLGSLTSRHFSNSSKNDQSVFITTPIFYVNAEPHIGHLYTAVIADAYNRYNHLRNGGETRTIFSSGTDEHGMKIEKAAKLAGTKDILSHCNEISSKFQKMCEVFNIEHTDFVRTTEKRHCEAVQHFWKCLEQNGDIYKSHYEGWYCLSDESFLTESMITEKTGPNGEKIKISTESGHPVEWSSEENYMFKLTKYLPEVRRWIEKSDPVKPTKFSGILLRWIDEGFQDLSVSRPSARLSWGIPVPGDQSQVVYVWLDALVNYLTVSGYPNQSSMLWPPSLQVVGKDIIKFHAIYWPAFLIAAGLDPPKEILCHAHWTVDSKKMSKSLGNVVDPFELAQTYGTDGLRYFLLREGTPHSDANFTEEKMRRLLNAELADTLGNLLSRCSGKAVNPAQIWPKWSNSTEEFLSSNGKLLKESVEALSANVGESYDELHFYRGLEQIMTTVRLANLYVEETKPWVLAKQSPADPTLHAMISLVFETLRVTSIMLWPVIPNLSDFILNRLSVPASGRKWNAISHLCWETASESTDCVLGGNPSVFYRRIKQ